MYFYKCLVSALLIIDNPCTPFIIRHALCYNTLDHTCPRTLFAKLMVKGKSWDLGYGQRIHSFFFSFLVLCSWLWKCKQEFRAPVVPGIMYSWWNKIIPNEFLFQSALKQDFRCYNWGRKPFQNINCLDNVRDKKLFVIWSNLETVECI